MFSFYSPWKHLGVFMGYKIETLARNGLTSLWKGSTVDVWHGPKRISPSNQFAKSIEFVGNIIGKSTPLGLVQILVNK